MPTFVAVISHPFIQNISFKLTQKLPGIDAQFEMAHVNREKVRIEELQPELYRESAVLLLLVKNESGFFIPLTERHDYKGVHSGQISFPGGKKDQKDENLEQTALRECHEEIGIRKNISIIGSLTPVYIPVSKFLVNPYVGVFTGENAEFILEKNEVKSLLKLKVEELKNPELVKHTTVEPSPGYKLKTPYFDVQGKIVWGATAMILSEFKKLL